MTTIFNVYSGELYELKTEELDNMLEGELPLTKPPKGSCKKCFGRGYMGYDKLRFLFQPCISCVEKQIPEQHQKKLLFNFISYKK